MQKAKSWCWYNSIFIPGSADPITAGGEGKTMFAGCPLQYFYEEEGDGGSTSLCMRLPPPDQNVRLLFSFLLHQRMYIWQHCRLSICMESETSRLIRIRWNWKCSPLCKNKFKRQAFSCSEEKSTSSSFAQTEGWVLDIRPRECVKKYCPLGDISQ